MTDIYDLAPEGCIYVCGACGKTSRNRAGFMRPNIQVDESGERIASRGWDESCMLHAVLCRPTEPGEPGGKWTAVSE